jgi:3-hydroxybutyryl-CoA dehydratase
VIIPPPPLFRVGPLTRTDIVRYAGASGDFNPIHHDETFARDAGLPSVMAHGMLSAGLLASFVTRWFGAGSIRHYKVRFMDRVWPGDVLDARGSVVRVFVAPAGEPRAQLALELVRIGGGAVITGSAVVVVPSTEICGGSG